MKQYLDLLRKIKENGCKKEPARKGMPCTYELFGETMKFDLQSGFPLLTTKKMHIKGILAELLWFISGDTNIHYLVKNGCNIWNKDAYKYYVRLCNQTETQVLDYDQWLGKIKDCEHKQNIEVPFMNLGSYALITYRYGDCGSIYGYQWRYWEGWYDQMNELIGTIITNPNSRYQIVTAWNPATFLSFSGTQACLPACHVYFQTSVRNGEYLDLNIVQRSCDTFLGVPYNIASYAFLTHILASVTGYKPGILTWFGNSVHIYENHLDAVNEQLSRTPNTLPKLIIKNHRKRIYDYTLEDFEIVDYNPQPAIKAPLSVGV